MITTSPQWFRLCNLLRKACLLFLTHPLGAPSSQKNCLPLRRNQYLWEGPNWTKKQKQANTCKTLPHLQNLPTHAKPSHTAEGRQNLPTLEKVGQNLSKLAEDSSAVARELGITLMEWRDISLFYPEEIIMFHTPMTMLYSSHRLFIRPPSTNLHIYVLLLRYLSHAPTDTRNSSYLSLLPFSAKGAHP